MSTTTEIRTRLQAAIKTNVQAIDSKFNPDPVGKNVTNALSTAIAPEIKMNELMIEESSRQGNPLTADSKTVSNIGSLENWGQVKLNRQPLPAVGGTYSVLMSGTGTVPVSTQFVNQLTGYVYLSQADTAIAGTGTVTVKSVGVGSEIALENGTDLFTQATIPGIDNPGTVSAEITSPVDGETSAEYKSAVVGSFRNTPSGGDRSDYVEWGKEVAGVTQVYPYTGDTLGSVTVYVGEVRTTSNLTGYPSSGLATSVVDVYNVKGPITQSYVRALPIIPRGYYVRVQGLSDLAASADLDTAVENYFLTRKPFIDTVDPSNERADQISTSTLSSNITAAIYPATVDNIQLQFPEGNAIFTEDLPHGAVPFAQLVYYVN